MTMNSKPRDYSYIEHKQNHPLELRGNMKKRSTTSSQVLATQYPDRCLTDKIINNYQDLKSIVPLDLGINKRKSQGLRVYHQNSTSEGTGANYLMTKHTLQNIRPQRKHLTDRVVKDSLAEELKAEKSFHRQKKHFVQDSNDIENRNPSIIPKKHSQTLYKKIQNDLHSEVYLKQNYQKLTVKMNQRTMFKQGTALGFQKYKQSQISQAKRRQITGAELNEKKYKGNTRQDWRKSSILLG